MQRVNIDRFFNEQTLPEYHKHRKTLMQRLKEKVLKKSNYLYGKTFNISCSIRLNDLPPREWFFIRIIISDTYGTILSEADFYTLKHNAKTLEIHLDSLNTPSTSRGKGYAALAILVGYVLCMQQLSKVFHINHDDMIIFTLMDGSKEFGHTKSYYNNLKLHRGSVNYNGNSKRLYIVQSDNDLWNMANLSNRMHMKDDLKSFLEQSLPGTSFNVKLSFG